MKTISESGVKRQVSTLQAAIVDGLESVKGQNIQVFDTTHLSPLFERVIVASATSSRQTKALAASVRDKVKEAGFDKPRTEGEENGEWVVVDCGAVVAHIMQPAIREYYRLEEIWGDKPVKAAIKTAKIQAAKAAKAAQAAQEQEDEALTPAKKAATKKTTAAGTAGKPVVKKAASKSAASKTAEPKKPAAKKPASKAAAPKAAESKTAVKKPAAKTSKSSTTAAKTAVKKVTVNADPAKKVAAKKPAASKAAPKAAAKAAPKAKAAAKK